MRISTGYTIDNPTPGNYALDLKFCRPAENLAVLYSDESSVALLDVTIGKEVSRYTGYQRISNFSLGSQLMAICGVDGNVDLFDVKNFPRLKVSTISTKVPLMSTDISSDDILMVCGSDDISVKKKTKKTKRSNIDPDLSDDSDGSDSDVSSHLIFADLRQNKTLGSYSECHSDAINSVSFMENSHDWLVSGGADGLTCLFDLRQLNEDDALMQSWNCEISVAKCGWLEGITTSGQPNCYSITDDGRLYIWNGESGDETLVVRDVKQHESPIKPETCDIGRSLVACFALPVDNSIGVVVGNTDGLGCLSRWEFRKSKPSDCIKFHTHQDSVRCAAWSATSNLLSTGGEDGVVVLHNIQLDNAVGSKKHSKTKTRMKRPY